MLVGLLIAVPWVGKRLQASGGHMAGLLGLRWGVLRRHGKELATHGLIRWAAGTRPRSEAVVEVITYRRLVKIVVAEPGCERKARGVLVDRAQPASGSRGGPALSGGIDKERHQETPPLPTPTTNVGKPPTSATAEPEAVAPSAPTGEGRQEVEQQPEQRATEPDTGLRVALELASALQSQGLAHDLLERRNRSGLKTLARRLGELLANGWESDALRDELLDGFQGARSATALLLHRARCPLTQVRRLTHLASRPRRWLGSSVSAG